MDLDSIGIRAAFLISLIVIFIFIYIILDADKAGVIVKSGLVIVGVIGVSLYSWI